VDHADHVSLLRDAVEPGATWADIGAGTGAFTLALADLLGTGGQIVAVDRDPRALAENAEAVAATFPQVAVRTLHADFTQVLALPSLDGVVMANSLHFVAPDRQVGVVAGLAAHLRAGGAFVVVEYDAERGNPWVPHPFRYDTWVAMAAAAGLSEPASLRRVPSRFLGGIYSAVAYRG
jgi:ubiquinone/menaquinone biosynthesis C-methylase UbiE